MSAVIVRTQSVPMTPDGSVVWERYEAPSAGAALYLPSSQPADTRSVVMDLLLADAEALHSEGEFIGGGTQGNVYRVGGNMAVKAFFITPNEGNANVNALRVNASLGEGLRREPGQLRGWTIRTPQYLGALIRDSNVLSGEGHRWVMSHEPGKPLCPVTSVCHPTLPMPKERQALYRKALKAVRVGDGDVELDDNIGSNTLVAPRQRGHNPKQLVKIDLRAAPWLNW